MIENRAKTLGNQASGSRTRYFAAKDSDVVGKKPSDVLERLSPPAVKPGDNVRKMEIVIDLKRPITLYSSPTQPVNIGTVVVQALGITNIDVHSTIFTNKIKVVAK